MRRLFVTFILLACGLSAPAAQAATGEYTVHACKYPDNTTATFQEANLSDANSFGWGLRASTPTSTSCAGGGTMKVGNPGLDLNLNEWIFKVPTGARIKSFTVDRNLNAHSAANTSSKYYLVANTVANSQSDLNLIAGTFTPSGQVFQACRAPGVLIGSYPDCGQLNGVYTFTPSNPTAANFLHVIEWCDRGDSPGASCSSSETIINRAAVTLLDPNAPAGAILDSSNGAGNLKGPDLGTRDFAVVASDPESGLLSAEMRINGKTVLGPKSFNEANAECSDKYSGAGGEGYDYNLPRPCPATGAVNFTYDTGQLPVGTHQIDVIITDAAGNQTVLGREITVPGDRTSTPEIFIWEKTAPPAQCSDGLDNDGDGKIDTEDPACHSDNNPNNPDSYLPNRDSETRQCSDGIDNDNDKKIDIKDPACHTDGDPKNTKSYDPNKDDEVDSLCTSVTAKFQPGEFEKRYTRVSRTGKTAITYRGKAKKHSGKSLPRIRIRGKLTGSKGCVAYWRIGKTQRLISKRTSNGAFTEFYFEGMKGGTTSFKARKNSVKLYVKRAR